MIDLDRFKQVKRYARHDVGDELLKAVAKRLRADVTGGDLVSSARKVFQFVVLFRPCH